MDYEQNFSLKTSFLSIIINDTPYEFTLGCQMGRSLIDVDYWFSITPLLILTSHFQICYNVTEFLTLWTNFLLCGLSKTSYFVD